MTGGEGPNEVGIVLYPGAQLAAVHGLTDLFGLASRFSTDARPTGGPPLRVTHWSLGRANAAEVSCVFRSEPRAPARPRILILPPTLMGVPDPGTRTRIAHWLRRRHAQGVALASVCSGVFLVAETGLLDGRVVSTHRNCAQALTALHPAIAVDPDRRMTQHADILTAGGFMAWVDVGLLLVERLLGGSVRAATARFVLSDDVGRTAPRAARPVPQQAHDDGAVQLAQDFIHVRDGQGITLDEMARAARLERRTLLRRFASATGRTPIGYCRAVRIARACELLEAGSMPLKEIAACLGYADPGSFSRAFRRAHGVPPGTYRKRNNGQVVGLPQDRPRSAALA